MNYSPKNLIRILEKKGFLLKRITGSHHIFFHPEHKKTVVVPGHGNKDMARGTFMEILKQAGISIDEL